MVAQEAMLPRSRRVLRRLDAARCPGRPASGDESTTSSREAGSERDALGGGSSALAEMRSLAAEMTDEKRSERSMVGGTGPRLEIADDRRLQ